MTTTINNDPTGPVNWTDPASCYSTGYRLYLAQILNQVIQITTSHFEQQDDTLTALKLVRDDEGYWSWEAKSSESPVWNVLDDDVIDQIYDITIDIEPEMIIDLSWYALDDQFVVDRYYDVMNSIVFDLDKMRTTYHTMRNQIHSAKDIKIVYVDADGNTHSQPLTDLTEIGTLIDPENSDDMAIIGWRFAD